MFAPGSSQNVHPRLVMLRGPSSIAVRVARLFPCIEVLVFDDDWTAIDRARAAADALGLSDRVHIHHVSAAPPGLDRPAQPDRTTPGRTTSGRATPSHTGPGRAPRRAA